MLVIKLGGSRGLDIEAFVEDLAAVVKSGERVVFVHGGNKELDNLQEKLGIPVRQVTSATGQVSRYTDAATMDAFLMAYAGEAGAVVFCGLVPYGFFFLPGAVVVSVFLSQLPSAGVVFMPLLALLVSNALLPLLPVLLLLPLAFEESVVWACRLLLNAKSNAKPKIVFFMMCSFLNVINYCFFIIRQTLCH